MMLTRRASIQPHLRASTVGAFQDVLLQTRGGQAAALRGVTGALERAELQREISPVIVGYLRFNGNTGQTGCLILAMQ